MYSSNVVESKSPPSWYINSCAPHHVSRISSNFPSIQPTNDTKSLIGHSTIGIGNVAIQFSNVEIQHIFINWGFSFYSSTKKILVSISFLTPKGLSCCYIDAIAISHNAILFAKFKSKWQAVYNEYIRPYFESHVVSTIFTSDPPCHQQHHPMLK